MKSRTGSLRSGLLVLFTALSLILAVAGNLLGNVVAERMPDSWKSHAPMLLAVAVLLYLIVNVSLARLQDTLADNWRKALNSRLRISRLLLLVLDALLAALGGLLSNLAAGKLLPQQFAPYAPLLYAGVVLLALAISFLIYWLQSLPRSQETNRTYFLERLRDRYETLRNGALQGEPSIGVQIAWEAGSPNSANASTKLTTEEALSAALPFFDASDGHLLLLGQPGAGKSVLLAELGLDIIRRLRKDAARPFIPVIFPLSTWAINRKPLADWLVESLQGPSNRISEKQARSWVDSGAVLPLLDGLDEVGGIATRDACAQAINAFQTAHPHVPLVVTSRIQEYREQKVSLTLDEATVEPLTGEQILAYLEQSGATYDTLRKAVEQNTALLEALKTLLFLRVVMRTYSDIDPSQIPPTSNQGAWIEQIFRDYVAQMLKHRSREEDKIAPYTPMQVTLYLSWLAEEMRKHSLLSFEVRQLSADWLPDNRARRRYGVANGLISGLIGGFLGGVVGGLACGVIGEVVRMLGGSLDSMTLVYTGLCCGFVIGLSSGWFFGLGEGGSGRGESDPLTTSGFTGLFLLLIGWLACLFGGGIAGMVASLIGSESVALKVIVIFGLIISLPVVIGVLIELYDFDSNDLGLGNRWLRFAAVIVGVVIGVSPVFFVGLDVLQYLLIGVTFCPLLSFFSMLVFHDHVSSLTLQKQLSRGGQVRTHL